MSKVMCSGSIVVLTCFCFLGTFGYATFASDLSQLCSKNILQAPGYNDIGLMQIARFALLISCVAGFPICMIPCKDSIEELFFKENKMTFN